MQTCYFRNPPIADSFFSRVLVAWFQATIRGATQHDALAQFELARRQRLLTFCFARWRVEFLSAKKGQGEERDGVHQRPAWATSFQRWRVAARGHQALHLDSMAGVKQVRRFCARQVTPCSLKKSPPGLLCLATRPTVLGLSSGSALQATAMLLPC